ncbi:hypothetical protein LR48_Vigan01g103600 [Vigna angularis]|uniref:Tubulin-folding cofactor C n=1 Tax=Phaseolus angularis TaxID=3914 RepID=A0A0L9TM01_PHAAN|nr:hypothetical protein LR48_Vigan01g103600 [Vigna angularis]
MEDETEKQKKHLAMVERLSKRPQSRSTKPESSTESTSSVLSHFSQLKTSIEFQLQQSQSFSSDPPNLILHFQSISKSISDLEKLVARNSYLLPSYNVQTSLKTVSDLRQSLQNLTNQLIPKTRFSFKNKPTKKDPKDTAIPQPKQPPQPSIPDTGLATRESHQIQIHSARKSDFYLRVRSKPIIEDSNGVRKFDPSTT